MSDNFGALPSEDKEWQLGKSAASIRFVKQAEECMNNCSPENQETLREAISRVKSEDLEFIDWVTPEEFLRGI
ncbi:MAG: hypothetical protein WD712_02830 [Candidatus Spechtbacterales bacterium]